MLQLTIGFHLAKASYCYEYSPRCYCDFNNTLMCDNFMQLNDLKFDRKLNLRFKYIHIRPLQPIMFDSYIYFNFFNFDDNLEIHLSNFIGFDLLVNPFDGLIGANKNMSLFVHQSELLFFYSNQLVDTRMCNSNYFTAEFKPLFASFTNVILADSVRYAKRTCPLLFQNSRIAYLALHRITDSNRFNFIDSIDYEVYSFNVERLDVFNSKFSLNSMLLNHNVFRQLKELNLHNSSLISFEPGLFRSFVQIDRIEFEVFHFYQFIKRFRQNQTDWLLDLNFDLNNQVNILDTRENIIASYGAKQIEVVLTDPTLQYDYPDSDFCLFRQFPFQNMIFPAINTKPNLTCTCTLVWLIQYNHLYKNSEELITSSVQQCLQRYDFLNILVACDFASKKKLCDDKDFYFINSHACLNKSLLGRSFIAILFCSVFIFKLI